MTQLLKHWSRVSYQFVSRAAARTYPDNEAPHAQAYEKAQGTSRRQWTTNGYEDPSLTSRISKRLRLMSPRLESERKLTPIAPLMAISWICRGRKPLYRPQGRHGSMRELRLTGE